LKGLDACNNDAANGDPHNRSVAIAAFARTVSANLNEPSGGGLDRTATSTLGYSERTKQ